LVEGDTPFWSRYVYVERVDE